MSTRCFWGWVGLGGQRNVVSVLGGSAVCLAIAITRGPEKPALFDCGCGSLTAPEAKPRALTEGLWQPWAVQDCGLPYGDPPTFPKWPRRASCVSRRSPLYLHTLTSFSSCPDAFSHPLSMNLLPFLIDGTPFHLQPPPWLLTHFVGKPWRPQLRHDQAQSLRFCEVGEGGLRLTPAPRS